MFRDTVDRCALILQSHLGIDIRRVLYPDSSNREAAEREMNQTIVTQPAIFVVEYALALLWMSWGVKPAVLIGHSIGEYVAAVVAGTFSLDDALDLLAARARLMQALPAGSMLAVRLGAGELQVMLPPGAAIAAVNSPKLTTISGPTETLRKFQAELEAKHTAARMLQTSHAFHSDMMEPIVEPFTELVRQKPRHAPTVPWVSTCTGTWMTAENLADPAYWSRQLRQTVHFASAIETVLADPGHVLLEVGPGQSLTQLARQQHSITPGHITLSSSSATGQPDTETGSILAVLGRLWTLGVPVDWDEFRKQEPGRRVPLPTYPFQRQRFWVEAKPRNSPPRAPETAQSAATRVDSSDGQDRSMDANNASPAALEQLIYDQLAIMGRQLDAFRDSNP